MTSDTPSALRRRAPEARKSLVIEAAQALFREKGYEDTSMAEVARRAGVAVGTVYLSFPDKPSLRIGVINAAKRRIADLILDHLPDREPTLRTALVKVIAPVLDEMLMDGPLAGSVDRSRLESLGPEAVEAFHAVDTAILEVMDRLCALGLARQVDPNTMPLLASGLMMSGAEVCRRGLATPEKMTADLTDMFVRLLAPEREG